MFPGDEDGGTGSPFGSIRSCLRGTTSVHAFRSDAHIPPAYLDMPPR